MDRIRFLSGLLAGLLAAAWLAASVDGLDGGRDGEARAQLERALRRSVAASYATYGAYPGSLDEIADRYGVQVDGDRFDVFYMPVAENLAPDITIIERGEE